MRDKTTYDSHFDTWEHTLPESTWAEWVTRHEGTYKWGSSELSSVAFMKIFYISYIRQLCLCLSIIFSDRVSWFAYLATYYERKRQYVVLLISHSTPKKTTTKKHSYNNDNDNKLRCFKKVFSCSIILSQLLYL